MIFVQFCATVITLNQEIGGALSSCQDEQVCELYKAQMRDSLPMVAVAETIQIVTFFVVFCDHFKQLRTEDSPEGRSSNLYRINESKMSTQEIRIN